ncbi:MAG: DUF4340 domain-containing protein [Bacteroidales bacterium]|nr:DUF4340 domain-containing protein [Bacteroidales bacterium]
MRNKKGYIIILIIVIVFAAIYYFSNTEGTLNIRYSNFPIDKPDEITEIRISSGEHQINLNKNSDYWRVNNKYRARENNIKNFVTALSLIDIFSPVSKTEKEQIRGILESEGVLVEIIKNKRTHRKYYVSRPAMNSEKTYMMKYRSREPFLVRIPSYKGNVADLFITDKNFWRDKTLFDYQQQDIKRISVSYPENTEKSFSVINSEDGSIALKQTFTDSYVDNFNVEKLTRYLTYFQNIVFENIVANLSQSVSDSIFNSRPYSVLSVEDINGSINELKIYRRPSEKEFDEFGEKIKYDFNRAYASFNENNELLIIQYYIFDPLLKEIDYFR